MLKITVCTLHNNRMHIMYKQELVIENVHVKDIGLCYNAYA